jgi:DNA repair protein RadA/Sms
LALAIAGNLQGRKLPPHALVVGELGLGGEVREVAQLELRLQEAARLGFKMALVPETSAPAHPPAGLQVVRLRHLGQALELLE